MNLAAYVAQFLVEKKIRHVFGYQGGAILKLLDEMVATGQIQYVQNFHEQASAFAADAYGRITGNIGVAIATSGPGATNLVTGIANAQLDSIPTLFITGQDYLANVTRENGARSNGFQDLDIVSIVKPITKYAEMITDPARIRYALEKAYYLATSGRPGAVLLDIPVDLQFKEVDPDTLEGFTPDVEIAPAFDDVMAPILVRLATAKRPVILVGGGARTSGAEALIQAFANRTSIPVVSTVNGLDVVAGNYGFAGLHGNLFANMAVQNADLLFAFGVRFGQQHVGRAHEKYTRAHVVHVDIDRSELRRIFPEETAVRADLKSFLIALNSQLANFESGGYTAWHDTIRSWIVTYRSKAHLATDGMDPVRAVEELSALLAPHTMMTSDVGQNQMWVAQGLHFKTGQRLLNSCGLGSMGYSLPAAIGIKMAYPERPVVAFMGDGGLQMNIQELMFLHLRRMPVKCVVFKNNTLGMMRAVQTKYFQGNYLGATIQEFACVDLEAIARAYQLGYRKVTHLDEIAALADCFADDKPTLIELEIGLNSRLSNRNDEAAYLEEVRIANE